MLDESMEELAGSSRDIGIDGGPGVFESTPSACDYNAEDDNDDENGNDEDEFSREDARGGGGGDVGGDRGVEIGGWRCGCGEEGGSSECVPPARSR